LKKNFSDSEVFALDISEEALTVARENAIQNTAEINFIHCNILNTEFNESIITTHDSLIVSNPPYVTESEKSSLHKNVLNYEPHDALFVPDMDPLVFYKRIIQLASSNTGNTKIYF
jgi:release factor glutamine methyltransferase